MKLTKPQFFWLVTVLFIAMAILFGYLYNTGFPYDTYNADNNLYQGKYMFGSVHIIFNIIYIVGLILGYVIILVGIYDPDMKFLSDYIKKPTPKNLDKKLESTKKIPLKNILFVFILIVLFFLTKNVAKDMALVYNQSVDYNYKYTAKVQAKAGYYDNMWKSYCQMDKNSSISKDIFIHVAKIIMENRKDGEQLTWKWIQENQQIPFDEFTVFYQQLNNFIISKRDGYYNLEIECQQIACDNNKMLDMFPNNIYNKVLKCKHIDFKYGFLSSKTDSVFGSNQENEIF